MNNGNETGSTLLTVDPDDVAEINAVRRADAHSRLARWLAADHESNNLERAHAAAARA